MAEFVGLVAKELSEFIPEVTAKDRRPKRIPVDPNILGDPLFGVEGPTDLELEMLDGRYGIYANQATSRLFG